jgi:hypothetical protein
MGKARLAAAAVLATAVLAGAAPAADAAPACTLTGGVLQLDFYRADLSIVGDGNLQAYDYDDVDGTLCEIPPDDVSSIVVTAPRRVNPHLRVYVNPHIAHSDGSAIPIAWHLPRGVTGSFDISTAPWTPAGTVAWQVGRSGANLWGDPAPEVTFTGAEPKIVNADASFADSASVTLQTNTLTGPGSNAILDFEGSEGADVVTGGPRGDFLQGRGGDDRLRGQGGNDTIWGGAGRDLLEGRGGNDTFQADDGEQDVIKGGAGSDTATADCGLDRLTSVESGC